MKKTAITKKNRKEGVVSGEHPQHMGTAALSDNDYLHSLLKKQFL